MYKRKFSKSGKLQYWREIIERASQHPVSCHAYCIEQGIPQASFYNWRDKLSSSKGASSQLRALTPARRTFAEVKVLEQRPRAVEPRENWSGPLPPSQFVDAKWVAELILHLHGGLR